MKLPDAPLLEVVFEFRWAVNITGQLSRETHFGYDPGYVPFAQKFSEQMKSAGYNEVQLTAEPGPSLAHAITHRYRRGASDPFPLVQIGHGIFACNLSTDYDWVDFHKLASESLEIAIESHPNMAVAPMAATQCELRYVDIFNSDLLGHSSISSFLRDNTKFEYDDLPFLKSRIFGNSAEGNVRLRKPISTEGQGWFQVEIANATTGSQNGILVTSRVVKDASFDTSDWRSDLHGTAMNWLEAAHDITSPFFKKFVSDELMDAFGSKGGKE